jgi:hypothetical protein
MSTVDYFGEVNLQYKRQTSCKARKIKLHDMILSGKAAFLPTCLHTPQTSVCSFLTFYVLVQTFYYLRTSIYLDSSWPPQSTVFSIHITKIMAVRGQRLVFGPDGPMIHEYFCCNQRCHALYCYIVSS